MLDGLPTFNDASRLNSCLLNDESTEGLPPQLHLCLSSVGLAAVVLQLRRISLAVESC